MIELEQTLLGLSFNLYCSASDIALSQKVIKFKTIFKCVVELSRKYPCPPQGRLMDISRRRGVSKAHFLNESMTLNGISGGVGVQTKNLPWEAYGYFLEQHNR